jgi:hypothetical protein
MIYKVFFEVYGKKLMKKVYAENMADAKAKIFRDIIFHKIEPENDILKNIFDIFGK